MSYDNINNIYKGYIYKISNDFNNKVYIGQTRRTIEKRFQEHITYNSDNTYIHNSIKKHGKEHFMIDIIEIVECYDMLKLYDKLNEREIYWINYYDSYNNGYNCTFGGQKTANSISVICYNLQGVLIGIYDTIFQAERETGANRNRITESCKSGNKYFIANNYIFRYINEPLTNKDIENIKLKYPLIFQYDFDGNLINTFSRLRDAAVYLNDIGFKNIKSRNVGKVCNKDGRSLCGFIWRKYPSDFYSYKLPLSNNIKIEQRELYTGKLIKVYNSINEAFEHTNINVGSIIGCLQNKQYQAGGFYWCHYGEFNIDEFNNKNIQKKMVNMYDLNGIYLKTFLSISDAYKYLKIKFSSGIGMCCKGKQKTAHGYIWKYYKDDPILEVEQIIN